MLVLIIPRPIKAKTGCAEDKTRNHFCCYLVSAVQSLSRVRLFATPWTAALSVTNFSVHHQLPKLAQTHVHQVGDAVQPPHLKTGQTGLAVGWVLWVTVDTWPEWGRSGGR